MQISLTNCGKRFNREWIFRNLSFEFTAPKKYAVTGANGSGKSTLLQIIAGAVSNSEGTIRYAGNMVHAGQDHYMHMAIAAPYLELIEEMTAMEFLAFHGAFKPLQLSNKDVLQAVNLEKAADKQIRYYSSGMKQRLKLAQAFFSKTDVLLLDEPTTNLDADGIALYHSLIQQHTTGRLVIISSNDPQEYSFCEEVLSITAFKK